MFIDLHFSVTTIAIAIVDTLNYRKINTEKKQRTNTKNKANKVKSEISTGSNGVIVILEK
jgi:hypothetical protein